MRCVRCLYSAMPIVSVAISHLDPTSVDRRRQHLDPDRVAYYRAALDAATPVTVFDVDGRLLLADGHHRVAAAQMLGRTEVLADVRRSGTTRDALRFAVDLAKQQRGMTEEEVLAAIRRRVSNDG